MKYLSWNKLMTGNSDIILSNTIARIAIIVTKIMTVSNVCVCIMCTHIYLADRCYRPVLRLKQSKYFIIASHSGRISVENISYFRVFECWLFRVCVCASCFAKLSMHKWNNNGARWLECIGVYFAKWHKHFMLRFPNWKTISQIQHFWSIVIVCIISWMLIMETLLNSMRCFIFMNININTFGTRQSGWWRRRWMCVCVDRM